MRRLGLILGFMVVSFLLGCGGSSSTVTVTISPTSATVGPFGTVQFTATVANTSNTAVTWEVNTVTGGDSTNGTISTSGLYTAPTIVSPSTTVTVAAVSVADNTAAAVASVTITGTGAFVQVSPSAVTLVAGAQKTFGASVGTNNNPSVTWRLNCQSTASNACGTSSANGASLVYTAPAVPPPGGTVTISATTLDNSAAPGSAIVTVQLVNGSLTGTYAFGFSGRNAGGPFVAAGSIAFHGDGNIIGGTEDINTGAAATRTITGGTYTVGGDGRVSATVQTSAGTETWQMVLAGSGKLYATGFDNTGSWGGTLDQQVPGSFNAGQVLGRYAFSAASQSGFVQAGAFSANGSNGLVCSLSTCGLTDINNAGAASTNLAVTSGSYTTPNNFGRGTLTLTTSFGTQTFAYYIISPTQLRLVELDPAFLAVGEALGQLGTPFSAGNFNGRYAMVVGGTGPTGQIGEGGTISLDGAGSVSSGSVDVNNHGTVQTGLATTGTYALTDATTGRSTLTLSVNGANQQYVFYPQSMGTLYLLEIDSTATVGRALETIGTLGDVSAWNGTYAARLTGSDLATGPQNVSGQLFPNGAGTFSGTLDINDNGATSLAASISSGVYQVANAQANATFQTSSASFTPVALKIYLVNSDQALVLDVDTNRVLTGILQRLP